MCRGREVSARGSFFTASSRGAFAMQAVAGLRLRLYGVAELYIAPLRPGNSLRHSCAFLVLSRPAHQRNECPLGIYQTMLNCNHTATCTVQHWVTAEIWEAGSMKMLRGRRILHASDPSNAGVWELYSCESNLGSLHKAKKKSRLKSGFAGVADNIPQSL